MDSPPIKFWEDIIHTRVNGSLLKEKQHVYCLHIMFGHFSCADMVVTPRLFIQPKLHMNKHEFTDNKRIAASYPRLGIYDMPIYTKRDSIHYAMNMMLRRAARR